MRSKTTLLALIDIFGVILIFSAFIFSRPGTFISVFNNYYISFLLFLSIWLIVSFATDKYNIFSQAKLLLSVKQIIISNLLIMGIATTLMFLIRIDYFSRTVVFGTILVSTIFELIWAAVYFSIHTAMLTPSETISQFVPYKGSFLRRSRSKQISELRFKPEIKTREEAILVEVSKEAFDFIFEYARIESPKTLVINTSSRFNIDTRLESKFESIVNLKRINDIRYLNKFFESANAKLPIGGIFIDFVESKNLRKKRILKKYPPIINYMVYTMDFIIKRVFPKFILTKGIYFFLTRGQNRVLTKAETFGRIYSCGFEVIDEKMINNNLFFVTRKTGEPHFPENPSYGPVVALERIGYKGKMIKVYKLRTMHPYAEYLQEYIYNKEGLQEGGKFKSDFRIATIGKILRTFWLDELPMLYNLFKGDMKLVGVRPLSPHYFSLYTKEHQERRINYKPGLIPPFYADYPKTLEEIMASEIRYMNAYDKHPFRTDFVYFFKAVFNIVFKRYRSK
jgi:lipopolysaccharide/colanic/teichoic acid biosynthesis glycosyltransferase